MGAVCRSLAVLLPEGYWVAGKRTGNGKGVFGQLLVKSCVSFQGRTDKARLKVNQFEQFFSCSVNKAELGFLIMKS
jgi:hypothetical protein